MILGDTVCRTWINLHVDSGIRNENGMLFAKQMRETGRNLHIVFVTSHKEYNMDAFDIFALDYIVKPVSLDSLERAVTRAMALHHFAESTKGIEIKAYGRCIRRHSTKKCAKVSEYDSLSVAEIPCIPILRNA
jgi:two-component SAPR family response regulator